MATVLAMKPPPSSGSTAIQSAGRLCKETVSKPETRILPGHSLTNYHTRNRISQWSCD
uniref:Uncharacterized protein n=1 Tax=Arundo donax TaxID=35708 RepID=A0A0A9E4S2_ARUDO